MFMGPWLWSPHPLKSMIRWSPLLDRRHVDSDNPVRVHQVADDRFASKTPSGHSVSPLLRRCSTRWPSSSKVARTASLP